jgi:hypothetical protein
LVYEIRIGPHFLIDVSKYYFGIGESFYRRLEFVVEWFVVEKDIRILVFPVKPTENYVFEGKVS